MVVSDSKRSAADAAAQNGGVGAVRPWVFDADGHVEEPPSLWEELPPRLQSYVPRIVTYPDHVRVISHDRVGVRNEHPRSSTIEREPANDGSAGSSRGATGSFALTPYLAPNAGAYDPGVRLNDMDVDAIETAALFPTIGLMLNGIQDRAALTAMCRLINDWVADYFGKDRQRLLGIATLPAHPDDALAEARRCIEQLGFSGAWRRPESAVWMPSLHDEAYEPLWSYLGAIGKPFFVHPGYNGLVPQEYFTRRFPDHFLAGHAASFPVEQMMALTSFICYGILDRHPRLKVGFVETGAVWAMYYIHRLEEHYEIWPSQLPLNRSPSSIFRDQCVVSVEEPEPGLRAMLDRYPTSVVFSSDYPHSDATFPGSTKSLLESAELTDDQRRAVMRENGRRLFDLT